MKNIAKTVAEDRTFRKNIKKCMGEAFIILEKERGRCTRDCCRRVNFIHIFKLFQQLLDTHVYMYSSFLIVIWTSKLVIPELVVVSRSMGDEGSIFTSK